uniref:Protein MEMO1 n=1 Tax=Florenciella parvula TaxID=236787 RepID=A0A7S2G481_9STRA
MASACDAVLGDLVVDTEVVESLLATGHFQQTTSNVDEDEHSIEMHLPYITRAMETDPSSDPADAHNPGTFGEGFSVVCIMVGQVNDQQQALYGSILAPYLEDPENFFVVSSDFCHWGSRFRCTPFDQKTYGKRLQIWEYISAMDHEGMDIIEAQDARGFNAYLQRTKNTICGRYPIAVLLQTLAAAGDDYEVKFESYAQSSQVTKKTDSSVSYASAVVTSRIARGASS